MAEKEGRWITMGGRHVFLGKGEQIGSIGKQKGKVNFKKGSMSFGDSSKEGKYISSIKKGGLTKTKFAKQMEAYKKRNPHLNTSELAATVAGHFGFGKKMGKQFGMKKKDEWLM